MKKSKRELVTESIIVLILLAAFLAVIITAFIKKRETVQNSQKQSSILHSLPVV